MSPLQPDIAASGTAWIMSSVLSSLCDEADSTAPRETGGIVLGYWSESTAEPVITQAIGPGPHAVHEHDRFVPDYAFHESEVARLHLQSNYSLQYLGDWHSHPGSAGYLSSRDHATLCRIATSRKAKAPHPLMLILAYGPKWEPVAWTLCQRVTNSTRRSFKLERWHVATFEST